MKCQNCGRELARGSSFCPSCGGGIEQSVSHDKALLRNTFSSSYFLAVCILLTISSMLGGVFVFTTLFAVAAWIIYANARSSEPVSRAGYRFLYTVFNIKYIFLWVAAGIFAVSGIVGAVLVFAFRQWAYDLLGSAVEYSADLSGTLSDLVALLANVITGIPVTAFAALAFLAFAFLCAAVMCLYNRLIVRHFVKYFNCISRAAEKGDRELTSLDHKGASVRMIVCGVIAAFPAVFNMLGVSLQNGQLSFRLHMGGGIGRLCLAAVYFTAFAMIKEYVKDRSGADK